MGESDTEDGQSKNEQMNFLASSSQKQRWQEYAEEMGFRNLSGLFRFAIEKEVKGDGDGAGGGSVSEDLTEQFSELVEGMNRIESRMQDMDQRLSSIERDVREDPDIKKLASEVFSVLPTREEMVEYAKGNSTKRSSAIAGTVEGIAGEVDEAPYRIEEALSKLQEDTHQVQSMVLAEEVRGWNEYREGGDEVRYYKES